MPNANRRRGAFSGWTRRRAPSTALQRPDGSLRLDLDARRAAADPVARPAVGWREGDEVGTVVVFCLDTSGRVLSSTELSFTSHDDLARQLGPDVERYPLVEAWQGSVCLFRQGGPAVPEWNDDD